MKANGIDYSGAPDRPVDYISVAETIAQSYPDPLLPDIDSTTHGVQKDALQNGWDARRTRRSTVHFRFEIARTSKGTFLMMEDDGIGLTGKVWSRDNLDKLDASGKELPEEDRWARFESFGFMRETAGGIGSRGQGKFLFIHASKDHEILYETLVDSGKYRVGATKAFRTKCPPLHWEGSSAKSLLKDRTSLAPLDHAGTRVIICEPSPDLIRAIKKGSFIKAIEETWWRNIEKKRAVITVIDGAKQQTATVPDIFPLPPKESRGAPKFNGTDVKLWRPDLTKLTLPGGGKFKTFELCFRNDRTVPEEIRGVAVLHYGMKVATIAPQYLPKELDDGIYGFVEFDEQVDSELRRRENQKPNHYDLVWTRLLPKTIRQLVRDQILEFARTKLGQGVSAEQSARQLQSDAERLALRELTDACKELGIDFNRPGGIKPPKPPLPPPPRPYGVMFHAFDWPTSGTRRVEHGERVEFDLLLFNTTTSAFDDCELTAHVFAAKGGNSIHAIVKKMKVQLSPDSSDTVGHYVVLFDAATYPAGAYVVRAVLRDKQGYELDSQGVRVYVAQDPPFRAPFDFVARDWSGVPAWKNVAHTFSPTPDPKLTYNFKHPRYVDAESAGTPEELAFYLYGLSVQGIIQFSLFLAKDGGKSFPKIFDAKKLSSADAYEVAEDLHRVQGLLMASWKQAS